MTREVKQLAAIAAIACLGVAGAGGFDAPAVAEAAEADEQDTEADAAEKQRQRIAAFTADALESLERSARFLDARKSFSFAADITYDVLQPNGQMLEFGGTRDVLIRRPDRMRIEAIARDGEIMQLFFDGETILIDMPREDAYVKVARPGSLYAALDYLVDDLDVPSPLEDLLSENFAADVRGKVESGFYVGHAQIGERICEQLAFRSGEVDFQLWVQAGDEPVPCRLVITYRRAAGQPQFTAHFHDWNLTPETDDELFEFSPPESAERIQIQALASDLREKRGAE